MIEEGTPAPDFELPTDSGETIKLSALRGKPVVLYFYPKDDTPGCTTQACGIRDAYGEFERAGAVVLGISPDNEGSHVKFKNKYELPFTLLADTEHSVAEQYGVWAEKSFAGKKYMGVNRSTFVIDADGNVKRVLHDVKPATPRRRRACRSRQLARGPKSPIRGTDTPASGGCYACAGGRGSTNTTPRCSSTSAIRPTPTAWPRSFAVSARARSSVVRSTWRSIHPKPTRIERSWRSTSASGKCSTQTRR